ncbi:MAG: hypothetical protein RL570_945, partial [Actinomycetota bacterium]
MAFAAFSHGGGGTKQSAPASKGNGRVALLLLLPGLLYLAVFFIAPLFSLIATSLQTMDISSGFPIYNYGFEVANYVNVVSQYGPQIFRSFFYALIATIAALIIS